MSALSSEELESVLAQIAGKRGWSADLTREKVKRTAEILHCEFGDAALFVLQAPFKKKVGQDAKLA